MIMLNGMSFKIKTEKAGVIFRALFCTLSTSPKTITSHPSVTLILLFVLCGWKGCWKNKLLAITFWYRFRVDHYLCSWWKHGQLKYFQTFRINKYCHLMGCLLFNRINGFSFCSSGKAFPSHFCSCFYVIPKRVTNFDPCTCQKET